MGDYCDYIGIGDPRLDLRELDPATTVEELQDLANFQMRKVAAELHPIKDRFLGLLIGNHDNKMATKLQHPIHDRFCEYLGVPNLGYSCILKLHIIRKYGSSQTTRLLKIYAHHGAGAGRKKGSKVNRIEDLAASFPFCDIYAMGHVHDRMCHVSTVLDATEKINKLVAMPRAFGITGTFLETYTQGTISYSEQAQYPPTALGVITFTIKPYGDKGMEISAHSSTTGLPL